MGNKSSSKQQSTSSSTSYNQNMGLVNSLFTPTAQAATTSTNSLQALLGLGGDQEAANKAFQGYQDSTGYQFQRDQGLNAISGQYAGNGLFNSGARGKALMGYGQNLASTTFDKYLTQVNGLASNGLQAGNLISGAGNYSDSQSQSTGSSKSKQGLGDILAKTAGSAMSAGAASDPRLKENILKHGELSDGLGVYSWNYVWDAPEERYKGVMADEVETLRPWALGPEVGGYKSVDYSKLEGTPNG
jgi:hypothetical protein